MRPTTVERTDEPMLYRAPDGSITISIPMKIRKYSGRSQVLLPKTISHTDFKEKDELTILQAALVRARRWQMMLDTGKYKTLRDIAVGENVDPSLNRPGTYRHLRASNLRPNRRCHESKAISRRIQD